MAALIKFKTDHDDGSADRVISIAILIIVNLIAVTFACLLYRNQAQLGKETSINCYGTLYQGREIKHPTYSLPLTFFLRRLLFSVLTVYLFERPQMQMIAQHALSLLMMAYFLSSLNHFKTRGQSAVEVGSELLLHFACIILSQFNDASLSEETRFAVEQLFLATIALLAASNFVFMITLMVKACLAKRRLKALVAKRA